MSEINESATAEKFYNNFGHKLVQDYLKNNARTEDAIKHALRWMPKHAQKVLDVGCGIGWSTHEIAKHHPNTEIVAVDLSQELLNTARELFQHENIQYLKADITSEEFIKKDHFDVVILLDVYEHIPLDSRKTFHQSVNKLLNTYGVVIFSCPSIYHQHSLKEHNPEGLQPVDEMVEVGTIKEFAQSIDGDVIYFQYRSIWHQHDYFHAVIQKKPDFFNYPIHFSQEKVIALDTIATRNTKVKDSKLAAYFEKELQELDKKMKKHKKSSFKEMFALFNKK